MSDFLFGPDQPPRAEPSPLAEAHRMVGLVGARRELVIGLFRLAVDWLDEAMLLTAALELIETAVPAEAGSVLMLDRRGGDLYLAAAAGAVNQTVRSYRQPLDEGLAGYVMGVGQPVRINHVDFEPGWHREACGQYGLEVRQILAVPIRVRQRLIGCLELVNKRGVREPAFGPDDELLLADAGECLGILFALRGERPA
ncbi:MAG: GAF domain-containing protein [Armatimonadetes bacterium]|nr:GAF domain-containing protein [Armatimonadota bacterium]